MKIFDAHLHIIDPRFPIVPNQGYLPPTFTCHDYLERIQNYELAGGAIVSGSFQAFDQQYLLDALKQLGPAFVGVTQLPVTTSDEEILHLDTAGVRAVRFNLRRGGSESLEQLQTMADRIHELVKWHVELYVDSRELGELYRTLSTLPAVSIDHLGLSRDGFHLLCQLVEKGVRVKATGFGRVDFDIPDALQRIHRINPAALLFGTDLPSTRAPRPYTDEDAMLVARTMDEDAAERILWRNAQEWYHRGQV
ncbi:amidohydrolase 2 [Desulfurispirillum indicum S5]|uniref:Amidohydrolase 2 n=1 Tax=Desulfurispirillum indicum (strain ATCC BAA-1389 / DSM 22839 / S5) TaxID=653733 RepID=E6W3I9_DESIS|nr:amidohydrolase family protein [Desulfurispirillum indicum]ADU65782.1 amidohydrolase 2 [Desulfurispirillum indicum S5]